MRSVSSTPRCPSASSPVQPSAERATSKVSCTCVGHVATCPPPPPPCRRAGRHVRALQQRARVLQAVPGQVRAELPRPGHHHLHLHLVHLSSFHIMQVENPQCERFASSPAVPSCYYTPCSQECMDQAQDNKCPRQVAWSHPHTPTTDITTSQFSCFQCQKFKGNRACCGEECPAPCMEAAARGECLPECKQYAGNPKCCRCVTDDDVCS